MNERALYLYMCLSVLLNNSFGGAAVLMSCSHSQCAPFRRGLLKSRARAACAARAHRLSAISGLAKVWVNGTKTQSGARSLARFTMAAAQNQQQHQNAIRETSLSLPFDLRLGISIGNNAAPPAPTM
jgi:hypothetical protein